VAIGSVLSVARDPAEIENSILRPNLVSTTNDPHAAIEDDEKTANVDFAQRFHWDLMIIMSIYQKQDTACTCEGSCEEKKKS